jgi:hypothetical protein
VQGKARIFWQGQGFSVWQEGQMTIIYNGKEISPEQALAVNQTVNEELYYQTITEEPTCYPEEQCLQ